ncbi:MAG TPA: class I SAM-dependent methyltransferase, partial [Thermoanaerobaculia bacterium]|nr:class I SAM-dependent methyltransferase [Thermoanaerobaculia bacterium]
TRTTGMRIGTAAAVCISPHRKLQPAVTYWNELAHHTDVSATWMAHPLVRAAINRRVSGDPHVWPIAALRQTLAARIPLGECLSIGCGAGGLERSLIEERIASHVIGVDEAASVIEEARRLAAGMPIDYEVVDARAFLRAHPQSFDAIFFHQSLHHFDELDELMELVARALRANAVLYLDEYVGPSRDDWPLWRLIAPNVAYRLLPRRVRRPHIIRAPINHEDPTEAIRSGNILRAVERRFRVVDRRDYGGNLLAVVYPNLKNPDDAAVARLIALEERLLRFAPSFCTVLVAEPR